MPSATPEASSRRRNRGDRDRGQDRDRTSRVPIVPEYQPLSAPLNPTGQRALAALLQSHPLRHLKAHLQHASEKLTDTAGETNDRLTDTRARYERRQQRRREEQDGQDGDEDEDDEEAQKLARTEEKVKEITARLEEKMREVVDAEVKLEGLTTVLGELGREADEAGTAVQRRDRTRRRGARRDADEMDEDEDGQDDDYEASPEPEQGVVKPPSQKLEEKVAENTEKWEGLSLTQRYTTNNDYIGFYRIVHDAKHPGDDIPPLPHPSTWFSHLEDPNAASTSDNAASPPRRTRNQARGHNRSASPASSDDIAIARERISLKCPLTLLPFKDPVTSTKCPHSFERQAIEDMISHSSTTEPVPTREGGGSGRSRRVRSVRCPVCSVTLTLNDLRPDPVLLRRVRRAEREAEESDEDGTRRRRTKGGRRSGFTVASDDDEIEDEMDVDSDAGRRTARVREEEERVRIKRERAQTRDRSTIPDTQREGG